MAAGPALEMWSTQSAGVAATPKTYSVELRRAYSVTLDAGDAPEVAYNAAGLPQLGNLYPGTNYIFCVDSQVNRTSPIMAIVTITYRGEIGQGGNPTTDDPVADEPTITWRSVTTDEPIDEDYFGFPIVTVNGEQLNGVTERFTDDMAIIERNYLTINRYALREYRRATNSDTFLGWPPGTARIMEDEATAVIKNGIVLYWKVRVAIQFRWPIHTSAAGAWKKRIRHEGYYVRDTPAGEPHIAWDKVAKTPTVRKVQIKPDGTEETDPAVAHWIEFQTLGSLPFAALGLV